jgi:hypothetical protein
MLLGGRVCDSGATKNAHFFGALYSIKTCDFEIAFQAMILSKSRGKDQQNPRENPRENPTVSSQNPHPKV